MAEWKKIILDADTPLNVGAAGVATGSILIKGTTSGAVTITTADAAGTYTLTLPTGNGDAGQQLTTDGEGVLTWAAPTSNTALDDIADPDADTSISVAGYETLITSTLNEVAHTVLTITDTTADLTAAVTLLKLTFTDNGDADGNYFECLDEASAVSKFSIGVDGNTLIAGTLGVTGAITGNVTGNASGSSGSCTGNAATVTVADAANDETTFPLLGTAATGSLAPATDASLTYNALTGLLTATSMTADTVTANTGVVPDADGGAYLGTTALGFSGLFLDTGATLNFDNSDVVITHAANTLTMTGGNLVLTQPIVNAAAPTALTITGGAHTAMTAATESTGANFNFAATKTWAAGAGPLATQREVLFQAPTYDGTVAAALTITKAATVAITGAPIDAGANIVLTNAYALWVQAGTTQLDGGVVVQNAATGAGTPASAGAIFYDTTLDHLYVYVA